MPTAVQHPAPPPQTPRVLQPSPPHLCLTVETSRAERIHILLGEAAHSLLTAIGAPTPTARHLGDAARVAGRYLAGHSEQSRCRLRITTDAAGITLAVTDYTTQDDTTGPPPAWLPVARTARLQPAPAPPDAQTPADRINNGLDLHRTPDGHLRLTYRTPWPAP
ncbi:hypothetical protein ACIBCO_33775 [Streptomyces violascens]|uniref:hypothetical protein n=1 Tax=Streptomyces violascens TaxID=67381 RepID=UPI003790F491